MERDKAVIRETINGLIRVTPNPDLSPLLTTATTIFIAMLQSERYRNTELMPLMDMAVAFARALIAMVESDRARS